MANLTLTSTTAIETTATANLQYENSAASSNVGESLRENEIHAEAVLREAIARYGVAGVGLSFNGGKDCTVMVALLRLRRVVDGAMPLPCLYVASADPFLEVDTFVDHAAAVFNLSVFRSTLNMKDALKAFLAEYPTIQAVLIGTRRTDPYSNHLEVFDPTDNGWPPCIRVHPVLDWSYKQIWDYLLDHKVNYCCLYDVGYTSLGGINNTLQNPALKNERGGFDPAYKLTDGSLERNGRIRKQ